MSEEKTSHTHMKIPYIQAGGDCLGTGWGCDKCYNADGSCACAEGTQPWGCGAGQKPMCKSIDEINAHFARRFYQLSLEEEEWWEALAKEIEGKTGLPFEDIRVTYC